MYELSSEYKIALDAPTTDDLEAFTNRLLEAEEAASTATAGITQRYSERVSEFGDASDVVKSYLNRENPATLTFRDYVQYLRA